MRCAAAVLLLATVALPVAAGEDKTPRQVLRLSEQAQAIASALPADASDARLTRPGDTTAECARSALAEARRLLAEHADGARGDVAAGGPMAALVLGGESCGAYFDLRRAPDGGGQPALAMLLQADCACARGASSVRLLARAPLRRAGEKGALRLDAAAARYELLASCEPCPAAPGKRSALAGGDACAVLCAPLTAGLADTQRRLEEAASRAAGLAGKVTAVQLQVSSDRRELDAAQAAPSSSRAVLDKVSALQARVKAAQDELNRLRQASEDVSRLLAELRRVTDGTSAFESRCRAQCPVPATRGGHTTLLLAGAAALAAGGVVALAAGGGSDGASAVDFGGLWHGTKIVLTDQGTPIECRRVFDEGWQISQNGPSLDIAVETRVVDCGSATCPSTPGCLNNLGPFSRRHVGTVSGSTAIVYPFLDFQIPSCALPMTMQGSTLRGSMAACATGQPTAMEVVLQRVGR